MENVSDGGELNSKIFPFKVIDVVGIFSEGNSVPPERKNVGSGRRAI